MTRRIESDHLKSLIHSGCLCETERGQTERDQDGSSNIIEVDRPELETFIYPRILPCSLELQYGP